MSLLYGVVYRPARRESTAFMYPKHYPGSCQEGGYLAEKDNAPQPPCLPLSGHRGVLCTNRDQKCPARKGPAQLPTLLRLAPRLSAGRWCNVRTKLMQAVSPLARHSSPLYMV